MPRRRSGRGRSSRRRRDKPAPAPESDKPGRRAGRSTTRAGKRPQRRAPRAPQPPAPETRDPFLGRNIAGYEILERLDTGATCITFGARQPAMDRLVTLDVLTDEAAADQATVRNFYDTARMTVWVTRGTQKYLAYDAYYQPGCAECDPQLQRSYT